ncbi:MAG: hypothetical protein M3020_19670, partial [Myxococcota bacterium]|nr:hypothetical protein [Myxococcota bacterium]
MNFLAGGGSRGVAGGVTASTGVDCATRCTFAGAAWLGNQDALRSGLAGAQASDSSFDCGQRAGSDRGGGGLTTGASAS